jgi:predicted nucleic acid-binding protein
MPLLVDTGVVFALADRSDAWHARVRDYIRASGEALLAPAMILPEVAYLLRHRIGADAELAFARALASGEISVEHLTARDWTRSAALMDEYDWLGFVDATVVAVAERLKVRTLATTDRRHFGAVRPAHIDRFRLVP